MMRKTISILVLVVVLCSILSSCTKINTINQKKIISSFLPQNKILYTNKQIGYTNIVKLNTNTKTKQILSSSPFKTERPIFSPDKKKVVFQTRRGSANSNIWDVYIMNLDGTELTNLTKDLTLIQTNNKQIDYLFSPDPKQLLIRETIATSTINTQTMHQVNIDSLFVETLQPTHSVFNLLDCLFEKLKKSIPIRLDDDHFLLKNKNVLGSFNCSTQEFVPIVSFAEPIDDYCLSPDKQFIIFNIVTKKDIQTYLFDIKLKKTSTITPSFGKNDLQLHIFWLQDEKKFIYSASEYIMKSTKKEKQQFLFLFDLSTSSTTKLVGIDTILSRFQSFSDHEFIGSYECYDGPPDLIYFDLETKKIENIQEGHEQPNIIRFYVQGENLIVFANTGFYIYNVKEEKITQNYINENLVFEKLYGKTNVLSTDQSQFYLVTRDKLIFFDNLGKQLHEEKLASFCNEPPNSDKSSFLYGSYTSPSETGISRIWN